MASVEFRIPMSPTRAFFHQARFFEHALRRLGGRYKDALLTLIVGDHAPIESILAQNEWSHGRKVRWITVPTDIFNQYGMHGTADYRYFPDAEADFIVLSDADTVLARGIDPLLDALDVTRPVVAGHMAHWIPAPVETGDFADLAPDEIFPALLRAFDLEMPRTLYRYSMDPEGQLAPIPPYFNLGFILLNVAALEVFRANILATQDRLVQIYRTHMRCQLAVTLIAMRHGVAIHSLPAQYNLANDTVHLAANYLSPADARVIHYLRNDELVRESMVLPEGVIAATQRNCANPINRLLQSMLRAYARDELGIA
jgi:hypothetical protein